jgi:hypothetical protein|tara:strand:+ start:181 stop:1251 length:1071 start_codon:yes stop_codon:yes gene_type:complete
MKILINIFLISCFSLTIISCGEKDENSSRSGSSATTTTTTDNTTTLSAPSDVSATLGYYQVALDWTAVSGASSYTVYWDNSTGISSSNTAISGITDDNYTHTGLDNGTTYYYKVATVNSSGTGSLSSEVNAVPRDAHTVTDNCTGKETASGTVQGVKRTGPSGTFYHSWYGASPSNGCIDNSTAISSDFASMVPSVSKSVKHALVITNDGYGFTDTWHFYSDTACAVETGFISFSYNNLATSDNITISSPPSGYPSEATKVIYKKYKFCVLAEIDSVETKIESVFQGSIDIIKGSVFEANNGNFDNQTTIWTVLDNISGQTINWFYTQEALDNNTYPNNFASDGGTTWHAGDNITR